jgi:hypothetical protein
MLCMQNVRRTQALAAYPSQSRGASGKHAEASVNMSNMIFSKLV